MLTDSTGHRARKHVMILVSAALFACLDACGTSNQCPLECTGGCELDTCRIACDGFEACVDVTISCPAGFSCDLTCNGESSCDAATVECASGSDCVVSCEGLDSCADMAVECSTGVCAVQCGVEITSCNGTFVHCGAGVCEASCDGSVAPNMVDCDTAASCSECNIEREVPLPAVSAGHPAPWDPDASYDPGVTPGELTAVITNPFVGYVVGAQRVYEETTPDGVERVVEIVESETRALWGTSAAVVRDRLFLDGELTEDSINFYAQDTTGNVWLLGGEFFEYSDGEVIASSSWAAGVGAALPGIFAPADPQVGLAYRIAYDPNVSEDIGEVVATEVTVTVPAGTFTDCVKMRETSPLFGVFEDFKYLCRGVGVVKEETPRAGTQAELMEYTGL